MSRSNAVSDVVDERIVKYYLLCTTRNGSKRHIASELYTRTRGNMITKKDYETYLRPHGEYFAIKDSVVGGNEITESNDTNNDMTSKPTIDQYDITGINVAVF